MKNDTRPASLALAVALTLAAVSGFAAALAALAPADLDTRPLAGFAAVGALASIWGAIVAVRIYRAR